MVKRSSVVIFLLIISVLIFFFVFYVSSSLVLEKKEVPAFLEVRNKTGLDLNTTLLTFGAISPGYTLERNVRIENQYEFPIKVELSAEGNISRFLVFEEFFYLDKGENKTVSIATIDPVGETEGNYSGVVVFTIKKYSLR